MRPDIATVGVATYPIEAPTQDRGRAVSNEGMKTTTEAARSPLATRKRDRFSSANRSRQFQDDVCLMFDWFSKQISMSRPQVCGCVRCSAPAWTLRLLLVQQRTARHEPECKAANCGREETEQARKVLDCEAGQDIAELPQPKADLRVVPAAALRHNGPGIAYRKARIGLDHLSRRVRRLIILTQDNFCDPDAAKCEVT